MTQNVLYGSEIAPGPYGPRGVIPYPETSASGNLVLRVGNMIEHRGTWERSAHVVMLPEEARAFAAAILDALEVGE